MVAINFQDRFADLIAEGKKRQTVRKPRADKKPHAIAGEPIALWTGQRTKGARLLRTVTCLHVAPIFMQFGPARHYQIENGPANFFCDQFAQRDGFQDWYELEAFFAQTHGATDHFKGVLITWTLEATQPVAVPALAMAEIRPAKRKRG